MQNNSTISHSYESITERKASSEQTSDYKLRSNQNDEQVTMVQKATLLIDSVTNLLCHEIAKGYLWVDDQEKQLPIQRKIHSLTRNQSIISKLQEVDVEEHQRKMKTIMQASRKMRQKRSRRIFQFQNSIKMSEQQQRKQKNQQRQKELQRRKSQIQNRLANKADMMAKIRQMSLQSNQRLNFYQLRVKSVKSKKFLYEQKEQEFKVKFILPKIQEEKKMLQRRKEQMKSIDISQILQHQKKYESRRKINSVNRSMTSRFIQCQTQYNPPEYVPKSYLLYEAEESIKKQERMLKIKQAQINKQRVKQFVKNVAEIHKLQKEISKSRQKSGQKTLKEENPPKQEKKKKKDKKRQLSKEESTNMGNQYFRVLLEQVKKVKQKRKKKEQQELEKSKMRENVQEEDLQIQIRSQQVRTLQKIQKIERNYTVRSKKIDSIFNDTTIDPLLKYEKLKHQVQNLDMALKTKNLQSQDLKERTEAAGSYLNAIKAKIKLLQVSNGKK